MASANEPVRITFRVPGDWEHPQKLIDQLPDGFQLQANSLKQPDGSKVEMNMLDADDEFFSVFMGAARTRPTEAEIACLQNYKVNICLSGPGGSVEAAARMMTAAAAIVSAGGAGVFIDNSGLAHSGQTWLEMAADLSIDAMTFGFVSIIASPTDVWTMGMHALGQPEMRMSKTDADANEHLVTEMMGYLAAAEKPVGDGHVIADLSGPKFRVSRYDNPQKTLAGPMRNPFGELKLTSFSDIAESN